MPTAFSQLDQSFPAMEGRDTDAKLRAVQDYLYQLLEQLRYILNNLSPDNFNEQEVNGWAGETIVKPIQAEITDVEQGLVTLIDVTAQGIRLDVHKECAVEWTAGTYYVMDVVKVTASNGSVKFYRCTATQTTQQPPGTDWTEIPAADVLHSRFDLTAGGLRSEVGRASGAESLIDQKADDIKAQVTDGNGNYTVLNLKSDGLHVGNASGTTTISGNSITTGTVTATQIDSNYVYAGDISANQITAGTLNAGRLNVLDNFLVKATKPDDSVVDCGNIGGSYLGGIPILTMFSKIIDNKYTAITLDSTTADIHAQSSNFSAEIATETDQYGISRVKFSSTNSGDNLFMQVEISPSQILIKKTANGVTKTYDLLDLLDQI